MSANNVRSRVHVDDVEWLMECHPTIITSHLAARFQITADGLQQALRRAGRQDLIDRLTRNVDLAGLRSGRKA